MTSPTSVPFFHSVHSRLSVLDGSRSHCAETPNLQVRHLVGGLSVSRAAHGKASILQPHSHVGTVPHLLGFRRAHRRPVTQHHTGVHGVHPGVLPARPDTPQVRRRAPQPLLVQAARNPHRAHDPRAAEHRREATADTFRSYLLSALTCSPCGCSQRNPSPFQAVLSREHDVQKPLTFPLALLLRQLLFSDEGNGGARH